MLSVLSIAAFSLFLPPWSVDPLHFDSHCLPVSLPSIASKDSLIDEFEKDKVRKNEEYVKALNEQEAGITRMLANMHEQFSSLKARYAIEIRNIEQAFLQERGVGLEKNMEEIESLFEKRKKAELHYKDAKQAREEQ